MQEEVEQRTLTLVINGTKFSGRVLKSAVSKFVAFYRNQKAKKINVHPKGKQSVKQLTRQGQRKRGINYVLHPRTDRSGEPSRPCFFPAITRRALTRAGQEYRWKRHDSLTVRGNKWYRHSQSKGGGPVDFVMEFFGKSFTEAVELLTGEKGAVSPPDRPI